MNWRTEPERVFLPLTSILAAWVAKDGLWVDERVTLMLIERWSAWEILIVLPTYQPHYPTYFLAVELLGESVMLGLSVAAAAATVVITMRVSRDLHDDREAALGAGFFIAFSPYLAVQAGWLRMYSILAALMAAGLWLGLRRDSRASWPFLAAALVHPFGVFGPMWNAMVDPCKRTAGVLGASLVPPALLALGHTVWKPNPEVGEIGFNAFTTGIGHGIEPSVFHIAVTPISTIAGAPRLGIAGALVLFVTAAIALPTVLKWGRRPKITGLMDWRLALWVLLPLASISIASHLLHPVFRVKYFAFIAPAVAVAIADPRRPLAHWLAMGLVLGFLMAMSWTGRVEGLIVARRIFAGW